MNAHIARTKDVNFMLPVRNSFTGALSEELVIGRVHGPFLIHRGIGTDIGRWVCTHMKTGMKVIDSPTKNSAMHNMRLLRSLPVSWEFDDPAAVKSWDSDVMAQIHVIRVAASAGGEA
jgi:hypothetical protein